MDLIEILKGAYRTVQKAVRPAVLGLALAYCGPTVDDDDREGCRDDNDCRDGRVCEYDPESGERYCAGTSSTPNDMNLAGVQGDWCGVINAKGGKSAWLRLEQNNMELNGYHCEANSDCTQIRSYDSGFDDCFLVEGGVTENNVGLILRPNFQETENRKRRLELEIKGRALSGDFIVNGQSFSARYTRM